MRKEILTVLRETGDFVSGQELCEKFGITRQAIWKNIKQLKDKGYEIESVPNKGYRLVKKPEVLYGPEIESRMPEDGFCACVKYFDELDSTNTRAKQLAEQGAEEGTLVIADVQTAGKGRRGRKWESEGGIGIWMSYILRPKLKPEQVSNITLLAALAIAVGIRKVCKVDAKIKWPNDIVLNEKKLCGILTEMSSEIDYIHYVIVGIGINANTESFPDDLSDKATSLFLELGEKVDRTELIVAVTEAFDQYYDEYQKVGDLSPFIDLYNEMLINRNREVQILYGMIEEVKKERIEQGIARGIDETGELLVDTKDGLKKVISGEVSVRGLYGYV